MTREHMGLANIREMVKSNVNLVYQTRNHLLKANLKSLVVSGRRGT